METIYQTISEMKDEYDISEFPEPIDIDAFLFRQLIWRNETPGTLQGFDCPDCMNRGYSFILRDREFIAQQCHCMKQRETLAKWSASGLGDDAKTQSFKNFKAEAEWQQEIFRKALKFAENPIGWFYIGGQMGAGKTHLCTSICMTLLKRGRNVRYEIWPKLFHRLEGLRFKAEERADFLRDIAAVDVLYIDDFLQGNAQDMLPLAWEIINERSVSGKTTIISSIYELQEVIRMKEDLGGRIRKHAQSNVATISREQGRDYRLR